MIPKWITKQPDPTIDWLRISWVEKHPDFNYSFYDDHDIDVFIRSNFEDSVYNSYKRIVNGSLKADFFRYCVLYIHGGVYIDVDISCLVPLTQGVICFDTDTLVTASDYRRTTCNPTIRNDCIYQAFLCAEPKHPFIKYMIDHMCLVMSCNLFKQDIFRIGGPQAFAERFDEFLSTQSNVQPNYLLREIDNDKLKNHIKLVTHIVPYEFLSFDGILFAQCQHKLDRFITPHYSFEDTELYI